MGTIPTKASGDGTQILYLVAWMGSTWSVPFPVNCFGVPANWNGSGSIAAQLIIGAGAFPSGVLEDTNGNPLPDGFTFTAMLFVEDSLIFDILALSSYQNNANGGFMNWPYSGGRPQPVIFPGGVTTPGDISSANLNVTSTLSAPGIPIVRAFPISYNSTNLNSGFYLYTPQNGEILLDAWVEVDSAWNGTTPFGDFWMGGAEHGWFKTVFNKPIDMTVQDSDDTNVGLDNNILGVSGSNLSLTTANVYASGSTPYRFVPAKFYNGSQPLLFVVSTDGTPATDPGSTQGSAVAYVSTVVPRLGA